MTIPLAPTYNTDYEIVLGFNMKGIRAEGRCPICKGTFKAQKNKGYFCPHHLTTPVRYTIDFYYKGERIRRGTALDGKTLQTFAQAHALLTQAQNEIQNKTFDPSKWKAKDSIEFRFNKLIGQWYDEKERQMLRKQLAPSYVCKLISYIKNYYLNFFGQKDVREIFNVKEFANQLPEKLSLKYQKNILDALRNFFFWLKENRYISEMPVFPAFELPEHKPNTIDKEVQLKILEFISEEHKPIFTFLFYQGCRPGEARALKWDCVNSDIVTYRRTWSGQELREMTKDKDIRENLIFPEVMAVLPRKGFPLDFVFTHGKKIKRPYGKTLVQDIFNRALMTFNKNYDTDLKITLYEATKHSFGTEQVNKGVPLELLQKWYGHSDIRTTEKYAKLKVVDAFRKIISLRTVSKKSVKAKKALEQ